MLPSNPTPLYFRILSDLEKKILSGALKPGDMLPPEMQMCTDYGVSRITVRRALEELVNKRLVLRRRGVGSFVAEASYANRIVARVGSIHESLLYVPNLSFVEISRGEKSASSEVAQALQIEEGETVVSILRKGTVDGEPVSVTEIFLTTEIAAFLPPPGTTASAFLANEIEAHAGRRMVRVTQSMAATAIGGSMAELLEIKARTAVLLVTRVYYDDTDRPLEMAVVRYHPQRYSLKVELVQSS